MRFHDPDDLPARPIRRETFRELISRRDVLKSGIGLTAAMFLGLPVSVTGDDGKRRASRMGFRAVAASSGDAVVVPEGYEAYAIAPWGSPLIDAKAAWKPDGSNTADEQALQVGDNHDGMSFVPLGDGEGLLVVNNEYTNYEYLFAPEAGQRYPEPWTAEKVRKAQNAHGVSILHLRRGEGGRWNVVLGSKRNRRITALTPMELAGPAAGHALVKTSADPDGRTVLGTFNNCANGWTPWGTYLACEENFNNYFGTTAADAKPTPILNSYGIGTKKSEYRWEEHDARFDVVREPNESNRFGWVVELDPHDAAFVPKKRTALGRFKHENAAVVLAKDGRVVVYMGDDQRGEYIYKFVSEGRHESGKSGLGLLDRGRLYVARFTDGEAKNDMKGAGEWLALDRDSNPALKDFASQAEVLIRARDAADAAGATPMDRPEWVAVHPATGDVYCTLTNNSERAAEAVNDANPRAKNIFGQIVRWREKDGDPASTLPFEWELFVLAGNPAAAPEGDLKRGSANVTPENTFNSPDGIGFSPDGLLWIQTDGSFSNAGDFAGQGNNQMLCADPDTGEIRRFLVGPSGCEITGQAFVPDQKTLFISIQHPGEAMNHPRAPKVPKEELNGYLAEHPLEFSSWPDGKGGRPRSAIVVIARKDGGAVGG